MPLNHVSLPASMADQAAVLPYWFWMNLARKVAKPEVTIPSVTEAAVANMRTGLRSSRSSDVGRSRRVAPNFSRDAICSAPSWWACDVRYCATFLAAKGEKKGRMLRGLYVGLRGDIKGTQHAA